MTARTPPRARRYLVFRLEEAMGAEGRKLYFTGKNRWTARRTQARTGSLAQMKAIVARVKVEFPGVIMERCQD